MKREREEFRHSNGIIPAATGIDDDCTENERMTDNQTKRGH